jgi:hypothetical protein
MRLPNGATVVDHKPTRCGSGVVYLAFTGSYTPYVTWAAYNGPSSTGSGHYFGTLAEALEDFQKRGG